MSLPPASRLHKFSCFARWAAAACLFSAFSIWAVEWLGKLLGFLTGASQSPMGTVIAPLLFALLAALGVAAGSKIDLGDWKEIARAALIAFLVCRFATNFNSGLKHGGDVLLKAATKAPVEVADGK